ncbi:MAG: CBS domain-containing protein [Rhodothermales bacterium]|nr:CBS domain-containing protein [Rhodothermales bacterium]
MTVAAFISTTTPPLRPEDTVEHALGLLLEMRVRHLPVVGSDHRILGIISEEQLLDASGPDATVSSLTSAEPVTVNRDAHVFDASKVIMDHELTTVPVVSDAGEYLGVLRRHELFDRFASLLATQEPGAILALEVDKRDVLLSQIIYLIEQNDVRVLSAATETRGMPDGTVGITLKLNVRDASRVRHILEHNGYHVVSAFGEDEDSEDLLNRVQEFLRYLEV